MDNYISNYTGAQIDNAIGIGLSKGAANGIASLNASGKVPSAQLPDMNFAPAGYGLGSSWNQAPSSDANLITGSGFQMATTNVPFGTSWWGILSFIYDNSSATQWAMPQNAAAYYGSVCKREKRAGTWSPWEWVNPPMQLGVEYRTTERYLGKPVYTQIINCGSMPDIGSEKTTSITAFNVGVVTFISGWCTYYGAVIEPNIFGMALSANTDNIRIVNINREANSSAVMYTLFKYTKKTD